MAEKICNQYNKQNYGQYIMYKAITNNYQHTTFFTCETCVWWKLSQLLAK